MRDPYSGFPRPVFHDGGDNNQGGHFRGIGCICYGFNPQRYNAQREDCKAYKAYKGFLWCNIFRFGGSKREKDQPSKPAWAARYSSA